MNPVVLAIIASICWGVGTALQKLGMSASFPKITLRRAFRQIGPILKVLVTNWPWMLGLLGQLGGMASFATALGAGDISRVQPIVCLTGVVAALVGVIFLKEKVSPREWLGIAIIVAGVILVGSAGSGQTAKIPSNLAILFFTGLTVILAGGSLALGKAGISAEFTLSLAAGMTFGLSNLTGKWLTQRVILDVGAPFSLGRGAVLWSAITDYPLYIVLACTFIGSVFFQTAFANGRASVVSPIVTIISNVLPIIAALMVFGEQVTALHGAGLVVVLVGTALLAAKQEKN